MAPRAYLLVLAVVASFAACSYALKCFNCEGNSLTCESSTSSTTCSNDQIYCRLTMNSVNYPFVVQQCTNTCTESSDSLTTTYCTRYDYGNCYKKQCNLVNGAEQSRIATSAVVFAAAVFPVLLL